MQLTGTHMLECYLFLLKPAKYIILVVLSNLELHTCFPSCLHVGQPNFPLNCIMLVKAAFAGRSASVKSSRALQVTCSPLTVTFTPVKGLLKKDYKLPILYIPVVVKCCSSSKIGAKHAHVGGFFTEHQIPARNICCLNAL